MKFSVREKEVIRHMLHGLSNKEIASQMLIGTGTVQSHVQSIRNKLGARTSREMLVKLAIKSVEEGNWS